MTISLRKELADEAGAHQRLFSPFDAAIGHFRRYNRSTLRNISPPGLRLERLRYLDSFGLIASAANLYNPCLPRFNCESGTAGWCRYRECSTHSYFIPLGNQFLRFGISLAIYNEPDRI
jgi:hypothetical protein